METKGIYTLTGRQGWAMAAAATPATAALSRLGVVTTPSEGGFGGFGGHTSPAKRDIALADNHPPGSRDFCTAG